MSRLPLAGVSIIDFCWVGAGSYMTKLLADMGADVVKVESTRSLDSLRLAPPFKDGVRSVNRSGYFADRNSSKRSITVNMKDPRGVEIVRALIAEADIVANNFRPGTMEKLGVGYDQLVALNPGLIYIGMSMNGDEGPDRMMLGYGITMAALTGFLGLSGYPDREPTGTGTNYPDHVPNPCHGAFAVMAALRHKRRTGEGQKIDMAQTEPMLALMPTPVMDFQVNGRVATRQGNRDAAKAPHGVYPTTGDDRWIAISVGTDGQWRALTRILGADSLDRPEWRALQNRLKNCVAIDRAIATHTLQRDGYELMDALQAASVTAGVVQNAADLIDRDPQMRHRDHWRYLLHAEMGNSIYNGPPFRFASGPVGPRLAAPLLGEHTREILEVRLGKSPEEIDVLIAQEVLI
ncbi:CaiB/BaiF CoA transferase family protein [Xanthobacter autotrophicus]|uniref:CaiB/BaiF CoA transferase family protein n=1 Tax=Xanthobacter autotrophicus TaxID=280 RepID=UPI0024A68158|nr:CoA transferase [Xanthobacter autotrophicus]MDI4655130.1 CoA transferase [Xanthobacter autotrophicus]